MKIDENLLKFPGYLPNDLEGFIFYYPEKFPPIVDYFEEVAPKIAYDPQAFRDYGDWARDELWAAFEKVSKDYKNGDQKDLEFLLSIDERYQKLYCYRFWIVNYLFPDGPFHDFVVDNLKSLIRKFIDVGEDAEDFEEKVVRIQRDLLQSDYADLYLQQALEGVKALDELQKNDKTAPLVAEATKLVDQHSHDDVDAINAIWDRLYKIIKEDKGADDLREQFRTAMGQVEMRSTMMPLYNMLTHTVEFREENKKLAERHGSMLGVIDKYKGIAKGELTAEEYDLFLLCYGQARNFIEYKDVIGNIDGDMLPIWFGLHDQIKEILVANGSDITPRPTGPTAVIHALVWYLPDNLKAKVMTPDSTPFSVDTI